MYATEQQAALLDRVTFTGADDSVDPLELLLISRTCPFVEWGILFSPSKIGTPRFPSKKWLDDLADVASSGELSLSAHLCGRYQRDALAANWSWHRFIGTAAYYFERVQVNCGADPEPAIGPMLREWPTTQRVILQCSSKNQDWIEGAAADGHRFDVLFDSSGGRGELPPGWPYAFDRVFCGYAGGLSPVNVADELTSIQYAAHGRSFWIDMEGRVRSDDGARFDLDKVRAVIESVRPAFMRK
jgi:hypothetical protein